MTNFGALSERARFAVPPFRLNVGRGMCGWALLPDLTVSACQGCYTADATAFRGRPWFRDCIVTRIICGRQQLPNGFVGGRR